MGARVQTPSGKLKGLWWSTGKSARTREGQVGVVNPLNRQLPRPAGVWVCADQRRTPLPQGALATSRAEFMTKNTHELQPCCSRGGVYSHAFHLDILFPLEFGGHLS